MLIYYSSIESTPLCDELWRSSIASAEGLRRVSADISGKRTEFGILKLNTGFLYFKKVFFGAKP